MTRPLQVDIDRWRSLVGKTLRGASFDRKMTRRLPGGLALPALSVDRPADPTVERTARMLARTGRWEVSAGHPIDADFNLLLADVERGADSLMLECGDPESADLATLTEVLSKLPLDRVGILITGLRTPGRALEVLRAAAEARTVPLQMVWGGLPADPWSATLAMGADVPDDAVWDDIVAAIGADRSPHLAVVGVSGMAASEAGGSAVSELALLLSSGASVLRACGARGISARTVASATRLFVGAGRDQLVSIALMRATRVCWARLCAAFGASEAMASRSLLHAVQSSCWLTRHDPWVNLLRSTIAGFSAATGGADAISLRAYDAVGGAPSNLGLRMTTNTQLLLAEESHLGVVSDPSAGSYTIEHLTEALCRAAWSRMQSIEAAGGLEDAAGRTWVASKIAEEREELRVAIDKRAVSVVGVSDFPTLSGIVVPSVDDTHPHALLPAMRHATGWEALRDAADAQQDRPGAFLATWGPLSRHSARAMFSTHLLQAGGVDTVDPGGASEVSALVSAFADSGLSVAVICGSDADYADVIPVLAKSLTDAGARAVWVAGRPPDAEIRAAWCQAGVTDFIHIGCDARGLLSRLHTTLGVRA